MRVEFTGWTPADEYYPAGFAHRTDPIPHWRVVCPAECAGLGEWVTWEGLKGAHSDARHHYQHCPHLRLQRLLDDLRERRDDEAEQWQVKGLAKHSYATGLINSLLARHRGAS